MRMKTDTRYLMHRDSTGTLKPVTMTQIMFESGFNAEERARLERGLPVDRPSGRWADMVAIAAEMFEHWDNTP